MVSERKAKILEMKAACLPKDKRSGPFIDRQLYVEIGFLFTRLFVKTRITPNQITLIWGIGMILSSIMFIFDNVWLHIAGAVGWILFYCMDSTDGQVARYKKIYSERGTFIDLHNHCVNYPVLFFCIGLGQFLVSGEIYNIIFGFIAGMFMLLITMSHPIYDCILSYRHGYERAQEPEKELTDKERKINLLKDIAPQTFANVFVIVLVASLLDAVFTIELFWMTSFLSIVIFAYAVCFFPLGFAMWTRQLYRRIT